jgi:putative PIN family toxin of toxin-antitoxin system
VIARPKFAQRLQAAGLSAAALVQDYSRLAEIVEPATLSEPTSRNPDDDVVLATACAARAALIVSGDQDLLVLGTFKDICILNAAEALRALDA